MTGESAAFQSLMAKGHSAAWEMNWHKAVEFYRQSLEESPDHPQALSSLALAYYQLHQYDEALRYYQRFAEISPADPMPFEKCAQIYEHVGMINEAAQASMQGAEMQLKIHDVDHAIDDFKNAIHLEPHNLTAHTRLAMIYDKMGRKDDAVSEYLHTAAIMQENSELQKAHQVIQYTLGLSPNNPDARKALALLNERQSLSDFHRVNVDEKRTGQLKGDTAEEAPAEPQPLYDPITDARLKALKQMATYLFEQNEDHASEQGSHRAISTLTHGQDGLSPEEAEKTRVQLHLSQAIDYQTNGHDDLAAVELESAIDLGLNLPGCKYVLGLILRTKDPQKALKYLESSSKSPAYELASHLLLADIQADLGSYREASASALRALKIADAESVPADEAEELIQLYEPIFEGQTHIESADDLKYLYETINQQLERPDWREYIKSARKQLPLQPEGSPPLPLAELLFETSNSQIVESLGLIRNLASEGKYRTAMEEAFHALSFAPVYLPLHVQMGDLLVSEGRMAEAVEKYLLVATLYNLRGDTNQAISLLRRTTKIAPMDQVVRRNLVELYKSSSQIDEALDQLLELANIHYLMADLEKTHRTYEEALALSRNSRAPRQWVVKILGKMADLEIQSLEFKSAVRIFEQIRSLQPQEMAPRATLIDLNFRLGQASQAMAELDEYLKILENSRQVDKAGRFLDELLKDRPESAALQKRMITFYLSHDQKKTAIEKLDGLAERLLGEGNKEASLAVVQAIIALNPSNALEYQRLYAQLKTAPPAQP